MNEGAVQLSETKPLPAGWRWVKLGEAIQEAQPGFACGKRTGDEGAIQLRMNNISSHGRIDLSFVLRVPATEEQVRQYRLLPEDIVFNNTNSVELVGKTALFCEKEGTFLYSNHLTRLRPKADILDTVYLAFWLQLQWSQRLFERICNRWIGQAAVKREKLLALDIPLPPLPDQKRIAAKLQELMTEVEHARSACEKQLEAAKTLSSAYLRQVFESDEAEKWERRKLGELFHVQQGIAMSPERREGISPHPFLRTLNVLWGRTGLSILDKMVFTDEEVAKLALKLGDLLVCEGGEVGRTAIWRRELEVCLYQNHIHRLRRLNDNVTPDFYVYWMQAAFQVFGSYSGQESKTTIPNLSGNRLKSFKVPLPPVEEQKRLASELKEKMSQTEKLIVTIEKQLEAINALPQAILRKAFRGEL